MLERTNRGRAVLTALVALVTVAGVAAGAYGAAAPKKLASRTILASADSYVSAKSPSTNFGLDEELHADASPVTRTYLRFPTGGISGLEQATLQIYTRTNVRQPLHVRTPNGSWTETEITFANAPTPSTRVWATATHIDRFRWKSIDVTSLARSAGATLELVLTTPSKERMIFSSREELGREPRLVVQAARVNENPTAVDDSLAAVEDTSLSFAAADLVANDTDVDGNPLVVTAVRANADTHGGVSMVGGMVMYAPTANYNGPASFAYEISDGNGGTASAKVNVTVAPVNDAPAAVGDAGATPEDTGALLGSLAANDTDVDGDALTVTGADAGADTHGTVALEGGAVRYTPAPDYNGAASFTYTVSDPSGLSSTGTVSMTVTPVNDAPVAADDAREVAEDELLTFSASDLAANDTDVDGDTLRVTAVDASSDAHGTVELAAGTITFDSDLDYNGASSFTYTLSDGHGATSTARVTVTVKPVNDPPLAVDDAISTPEDAPLALGGSSLTGNDLDVDGDVLVVTTVAPGADTHGSVDVAGGIVTYMPEPNYNGPASFGYTVTDAGGVTSSAVAWVTVTPVNDAPQAGADVRNAMEDAPLVFAAADLVANDADVDGDSLSVSGVASTGDTHGSVALVDGNVTYTPTPNFNGSASFAYTVSDGQGGSSDGVVGVSVAAVNDAPVARDDAQVTDQDAPVTFSASGLVGNDEDVDGDSLAVTGVAATADTHGTVALAGDSVTYTPAAGYYGPASFAYTVADPNGGSATGTVAMTVTSFGATVETTPMPNAGDAADDPAIWVNPADPAASTIIGTDKLGGIAVFDLAGNQIQYRADGRLNNVDLRSGVTLGGVPTTIVVAGNRTTRRLHVYKVDPATRMLVPAESRTILGGLAPMGVCMYSSAATGRLYVVINSDAGNVEQWELYDNGLGLIDAQLVRSFSVGSETEGCVADDGLGYLYISEEDVGIWKYGAEPDAGSARTMVDPVGTGHLTADVEGLTIVYGEGARGYLLASSQGNSSYAVYRRDGANPYVRSFRIRNAGGVDATSSTDGIDATLSPLGPAFPNGVLVVQDDVNCLAAVFNCGATARANQNFKLVPWQSLALPTP